jgi:hypothetical protein
VYNSTVPAASDSFRKYSLENLAHILKNRNMLYFMRESSLISKLISIFAMLILIIGSTQWGFLLASFLLGAALGTRMIIMPPAVKKLSGLTDATGYFALLSIFILPVAMGLPIMAGYFLYHFSNLG